MKRYLWSWLTTTLLASSPEHHPSNPSSSETSRMSSSSKTTIPALVQEAHDLYQATAAFTSTSKLQATVAPGRVNLIGEHTDYTGGFVLPFAIDYATVVVGSGSLIASESSDGPRANLAFVSAQQPADQKGAVTNVELTLDSSPPAPAESSWTNYVIGAVYQYLSDVPVDQSLQLQFAISGNVPLGSGLSSSAALEVAVARFVEGVIGTTKESAESDKIRAQRCQKAENVWCHSPCGIMDQYVSSAAQAGQLLLLDCESLEAKHVAIPPAKQKEVVLVVTNSNVQHDIAGGEYPIRAVSYTHLTLPTKA